MLKYVFEQVINAKISNSAIEEVKKHQFQHKIVAEQEGLAIKIANKILHFYYEGELK